MEDGVDLQVIEGEPLRIEKALDTLYQSGAIDAIKFISGREFHGKAHATDLEIITPNSEDLSYFLKGSLPNPKPNIYTYDQCLTTPPDFSLVTARMMINPQTTAMSSRYNPDTLAELPISIREDDRYTSYDSVAVKALPNRSLVILTERALVLQDPNDPHPIVGRQHPRFFKEILTEKAWKGHPERVGLEIANALMVLRGGRNGK